MTFSHVELAGLPEPRQQHPKGWPWQLSSRCKAQIPVQAEAWCPPLKPQDTAQHCPDANKELPMRQQYRDSG